MLHKGDLEAIQQAMGLSQSRMNMQVQEIKRTIGTLYDPSSLEKRAFEYILKIPYVKFKLSKYQRIVFI